MTRIYSGDVMIEVDEPRECEGCGTVVEDLYEDDGMNSLCKACAELEDGEPEDDELPEGWNGDGR